MLFALWIYKHQGENNKKIKTPPIYSLAELSGGLGPIETLIYVAVPHLSRAGVLLRDRAASSGSARRAAGHPQKPNFFTGSIRHKNKDGFFLAPNFGVPVLSANASFSEACACVFLPRCLK